ncbi:MAG: carbon-nitrogen hydrolase family protein [Myxococcota bacterium]
MKVAVAQVAPVLLDRDATMARVLDMVDAAAAQGAHLVAFGETLVPAYPVWLSSTGGARFNDPVQKDLFARYVEQAVTRADLQVLCDRARARSMAVVIGVAERSAERGNTLYCSRVFIGADGVIGSIHRKLMPTYEERLVWGVGDGAGLVTHDVQGFQVSGLNCWENWMPLARAAIYAAGAEVHVMLWPGAVRLTEDITPFVAKEMRGYVISASNLIRRADLPSDLQTRMPRDVYYDGGSCIAGPDGAWLVPPQVNVEGLWTAELDRHRLHEERQNFNPVGHYARPDVLSLHVDRRRHRAATFQDD